MVSSVYYGFLHKYTDFNDISESGVKHHNYNHSPLSGHCNNVYLFSGYGVSILHAVVASISFQLSSHIVDHDPLTVTSILPSIV